MTDTPCPIDSARVQSHLDQLCSEIGVRLAGTEGESAAATYIKERMAGLGGDVSIASFPVMSRHVISEDLQVRINGDWLPFPCSLFSNTPGTEGRRIEAPLVFFSPTTEYARPDLEHLRGKAVVHLGTHIESRDAYRRLVEAEPAFLLFVNVKYPGDTALADGMFPAYTQSMGARPTLSVAYLDAWEWQRQAADAARICVVGGMVPGVSQNVITELPGPADADGVIYVGAHHDTQANSMGADDNASGVAGLIELARVLKPLPRRRPIRLISFGAEEQLSVGSSVYVRAHREALQSQGGVMFNLDSFGSHMGWSTLTANGPKEMIDAAVAAFVKHGVYPRVDRSVCPYTDQFPFIAAGIPGLSLLRENCASGRFFHHRPDDDLSRVSADRMAVQLDATADVVASWAGVDVLPFDVNIPEQDLGKVRDYWDDCFGGW